MGKRLPDLPDLWAPAGRANLPIGLRTAYEREDWSSVREALSTVMDGAITDGPLGRELLQLVMSLPAGVEAVFDRYRAAAMFDHGDWDGLKEALPGQSIEPLEIRGKRDILTAPVDRMALPESETNLQKLNFEVSEYHARSAFGALRHWAQRISGYYPTSLWERADVAVGRHMRYRQLHDAALLSVAEAHAGRLSVAHALANEARRLGDPREPIRAVVDDIAELSRRAMGDNNEFELRVPMRIGESTGPSPLGAAEMLIYVLPLVALRDDEALLWSSRLLSDIAARLASPRWALLADSWQAAAELRAGASAPKTELAALLARSRRASSGLKALPTYLAGYVRRSTEALADAEELARRSGNVWLQVSSLTWLAALDPTPKIARRLRLLLQVTGWRRPILVPSEIVADAALGATAMGERAECILEFAMVADRPNVTTELVTRYVDDASLASATHLAAVDALSRIGTTHARDLLKRLTQRRDEIGVAAATASQRPALGLSQREIEVLTLAGDGLTNKQIGDKLFLSPHTIARHLANARGKLGASNRAEAAVLLRRPSEVGLRGPGEGT